MDTPRFLNTFRSIIALSIILLFASCGGGGGGSDDEDGTEALSLTLNSPAGDVTINEGEAVAFQVTVSGGTTPYTFDWNFNGGATNSNVEDPGAITFSTSGTYNVTLTVTDTDGNIQTVSTIITVQGDLEPQPKDLNVDIASPSGNKYINQGGSVYFKATASGGTPPYRYHWDFDGGAINVAVKDPGSRIFHSTGTFNVILEVTDNEGVIERDSLQITVESNVTSTAVPDVRGFQIIGQGNDTTFVGEDVTFLWNSVVSDSGSPPIIGYVIEIWVGGINVRREHITDNAYSYYLWFFTRKRTFKLKGVDIPAFLNLTKENRKGLRHVHGDIVSRVWNSWVSACSYGIFWG